MKSLILVGVMAAALCPAGAHGQASRAAGGFAIRILEKMAGDAAGAVAAAAAKEWWDSIRTGGAKAAEKPPLNPPSGLGGSSGLLLDKNGLLGYRNPNLMPSSSLLAAENNLLGNPTPSGFDINKFRHPISGTAPVLDQIRDMKLPSTSSGGAGNPSSVKLTDNGSSPQWHSLYTRHFTLEQLGEAKYQGFEVGKTMQVRLSFKAPYYSQAAIVPRAELGKFMSGGLFGASCRLDMRNGVEGASLRPGEYCIVVRNLIANTNDLEVVVSYLE